MPINSLDRVTVYRVNTLSKHTDLKLKNYDQVADGSKTLGGKKFKYWLYFLRSQPLPPSWYSVFQGLPLKLRKGRAPQFQLAGFVMLVQLATEFYALTGGLGHIALRADNEIEHRFGSILAEKILSILEMRGLVQKDTSGVVLRLDRVFRGRYNPQSEIDNLRRILSSVRGSLDKNNKYYLKIGKSIQAGNALTVNGSKSFDALFRFLAEVSKLGKSKERQLIIPQLEQIDKKANAALVTKLESEFITTLVQYKADGAVSLFLDGEDTKYLSDVVTTYQLVYGHGKHNAAVSYQELLEQVGAILMSLLKVDRAAGYQKMKLRVTADDGSQEARALSHYVCGDIACEGESYFIDGGRWYRASQSFLALVDRELDNITCVPPKALKLVPWDVAKYHGKMAENEFNIACCKKGGHVLLDRRTVKIPNERGPVEFCDILADYDSLLNLIHVKKANGAGLRELFAQGSVSADLYQDRDFRKLVHTAELNGKVKLTARDKARLAALAERRRRDFRIVYAIFDNTPSNKIPAGATVTSKVFKGTLTPFAKVDLLDRVQRIRGMGYNDVVLVRIADK